MAAPAYPQAAKPNGRPPQENRLSDQPPADPLRPYTPADEPSGTPLSGRPYPPASGDALDPEPYRPPAAPTYRPGHAPLPHHGTPDYPPTAEFPAVPAPHGPTGAGGPPAAAGHGAPGYPPPGYAAPPARRSNAPLLAVIVAAALLLCGGGMTALLMVARHAGEKAREALASPTAPAVPTDVPHQPAARPTLPALPTDLPQLPGLGDGKPVKVTYEVTGDGPAEILYTEQDGSRPVQLHDQQLPWRTTTTLNGAALLSVVAVRAGFDAGTIGCTARVDGTVVARSSHHGSLAAAACNEFHFG
jgi:Mycobacterium membrane protein